MSEDIVAIKTFISDSAREYAVFLSRLERLSLVIVDIGFQVGFDNSIEKSYISGRAFKTNITSHVPQISGTNPAILHQL